MPKTYRASKAVRFPQRASYIVPVQQSYLDIEIPATKINKVSGFSSDGFEAFHVHHEMIIEHGGRAKGVSFTHYAAPFEFYMHLRGKDRLLLVQTNKKVCIDFISNLIRTNDFEIQTFVVDFEALLPHTTNVKGAWFRFNQVDLRASAHFGDHVDRSLSYQESLQHGDMSSLYILYDFDGEQTPVQITSDGGIVLYNQFAEIGIELSIVESVINMLNSISALKLTEAKKPSKPSLSKKAQKLKNPVPLTEMLEENEL